MEAAVLFGVFLGAALIGVPLAFSMLLTVVTFVLLLGKSYPFQAVALAFIGGIEPFYLIAIPLFVLAGELMTRGGVGQRLIAFATKLFSFMTGGLGVVTVSSSMLFAGMSGSAVADSAAVGSVMIPGMTKRGYSRAYAAALVAAAGTIGIIIPPSIPMIVYAFVANVSVAELFIAGIVPGFIFGFGLIFWSIWIGRSRGWDLGGEPAGPRELARSFVECLPALLVPVIILGGIFGGVFTATEAAAVAVFYALLVGLFVYRGIGLADLPEIILQSFITSATVILVIGAATALSWVATYEGLPFMLVELIREWTDSKIVFLIMVNMLVLILGMFIDTVSALIVTVPLLLPVARAFGIDPVHFGLVLVCNLAIGLYTPPVGFNLFLATKIAGEEIGPVMRELVPILMFSLAILFLLSYVPELSMTLVHLYRGY
jgi:C4-dicarboxylate transporter DctM subunit